MKVRKLEKHDFVLEKKSKSGMIKVSDTVRNKEHRFWFPEGQGRDFDFVMDSLEDGEQIQVIVTKKALSPKEVSAGSSK